MLIRPETAPDAADAYAIAAVVEAAFGRAREAEFVAAFRASDRCGAARAARRFAEYPPAFGVLS